MQRSRPTAVSAVVAAAVMLAGWASGPAGATTVPDTEPADPGEVVFFSTQFAPVEEADLLRENVLSSFAGDAEFVAAADEAEFVDRMTAESEAGGGDVGLLGALHGTYVDLQAGGLLTDLSDLAADLADAGIPPDLLELGKLGTDQQWYIPWVQASYIMVAHNDALQYLPEGADVQSLTYDQYLEWAKATAEATGAPRFGFPAGEEGLMHRYLEGYLVPAFSGGVVTTFTQPEAWEYLAELWPYIHPQSQTYGFMQDPLLSGEVLVAWDHTARLKNALDTQPDNFTTFPAPAGPSGRASMPVVAGLAIPATSANPEGAAALIRHLLDPASQTAILRDLGFFPVVDTREPTDLPPGATAEAAAVEAQAAADDALLVLLPIGLGDQGGTLNDIYRSAFERIVVGGEDTATVLAEEGARLQEVMTATGAVCWHPDPPSDGPCTVAN